MIEKFNETLCNKKAKEYADAICRVYAESHGIHYCDDHWELYHHTISGPKLVTRQKNCRGGIHESWMKTVEYGRRALSTSLYPNVFFDGDPYNIWMLDTSLYYIPEGFTLDDDEIESEFLYHVRIDLNNSLEQHVILIEMELL